MIKNVLLSHNSIPTITIGSWKRMLTDLNEYNDTVFDYIVCPIEDKSFLTSKHINIQGYRNSRLLNKLIKFYKFKNYTHAIGELIKKEEKIVITIVDNYSVLLSVDDYLKKNKRRNDAKIVFLQHGHNYYLSPKKKQTFFNAIDLLVLLTMSSYKAQLFNVHSIPCRVRQIYNGVDSKIFKTVDKNEKIEIRKRLGFNTKKKYFLWLSQDRKKKGLHIVLKIWNKIIEQNDNVELLIIGTDRNYNMPQVTSLGLIPNDELPKYYKLSDFYLFPTLCYEGHSLSLTEALKSGCYCIASNLGPTSEILDHGNYGQLVNNPHFGKSWFDAINFALKKYISNDNENPYLSKIPKNIYDLAEWRDEITLLLNEEKQSVN